MFRWCMFRIGRGSEPAAFPLAIISGFLSQRRSERRARRLNMAKAGLGKFGAFGSMFFYICFAIILIAFYALIGIAALLGRFYVWAYKNLSIEANAVIWAISLIVGVIIYVCN